MWVVYAINISNPGLVDRAGHLKGADFLQFYVLGHLAADGAADVLYDNVAYENANPPSGPRDRRNVPPGLSATGVGVLCAAVRVVVRLGSARLVVGQHCLVRRQLPRRVAPLRSAGTVRRRHRLARRRFPSLLQPGRSRADHECGRRLAGRDVCRAAYRPSGARRDAAGAPGVQTPGRYRRGSHAASGSRMADRDRRGGRGCRLGRGRLAGTTAHRPSWSTQAFWRSPGS